MTRKEFDTLIASGKYTMKNYIETQIKEIREKVGSQKVLLALSGGLDSSVCAALLAKAIPEQLTCIFVDHGLMRLNEGNEIENIFSKRNINFIRVNAEERFLGLLNGVVEPEKKRKIIGEEFIRIFEEEAKKLGDIGCLVQGTIYPDIMESGQNGYKQVKAHHNVGGMPLNIEFETIIEPIKLLFKEEVRECGRALGMPESFASRQPFPGPGLAVRCLGGLTKPRLDILREADVIFCEEIEKAGLQKEIQQYFAILPGVQSVGVRDGARCYEELVALRAMTTKDFVTANPVRLPYDLLETVINRITSEVVGVNRVVYDFTPKPPSTMEWE